MSHQLEVVPGSNGSVLLSHWVYCASAPLMQFPYKASLLIDKFERQKKKSAKLCFSSVLVPMNNNGRRRRLWGVLLQNRDLNSVAVSPRRIQEGILKFLRLDIIQFFLMKFGIHQLCQKIADRSRREIAVNCCFLVNDYKKSVSCWPREVHSIFGNIAQTTANTIDQNFPRSLSGFVLGLTAWLCPLFSIAKSPMRSLMCQFYKLKKWAMGHCALFCLKNLSVC